MSGDLFRGVQVRNNALASGHFIDRKYQYSSICFPGHPSEITKRGVGGNAHPTPSSADSRQYHWNEINHGHHIHSQVSLFNFSLLYSSDLTANVFSYRSLYRRSLKLSLDWSIRRDVWRPQALNIRELFEANRDVKEPRQLRVWKFAPSLLY